jgi:hypothetical protein
METLAQCTESRCSASCAAPPAPAQLVAQCTKQFDSELSDLSTTCATQRDCACRSCNEDWLACLADPRCVTFLDCALKECSGAICGTKAGYACGATPADELFRRTRFCSEHYCGACLNGMGSP